MIKYIKIILILISVQCYGQKTIDKKNIKYETIFLNAIKEKSLENYEEAIQGFSECIEINPKLPSAFYQLSLINRKIKNLEEARKNAKKATQIDVKNKWYRENYAEILFEQERYLESIKEYNILVKDNPKNQKYYFMISDMYVFLKKYQEAINTLNELENFLGKNKMVYMQTYKLYMMRGDALNALREIEKLCLKFPKDLEALEILSELYFLNDKHEDGIRILEKITKIDPKNGKRHITLSKHYAIQGEEKKRYDELEKAFYNKQLSIEEKLIILYQELSDLEQKKELKDSIRFHQKKENALKLCSVLTVIHNTNSQSYAIYGHFLYRDKKDKKAEEQYIKSLDINPNNTDVWTHLLFLQTKEKDFVKIERTSSDALNYFPTDPLYYYYNGISHYQLKNYKKAIEAFKNGLEFTSEDNIFLPDFFSSLGDLFHKINEHEKSDSLYELSLSYNFENPVVLNNYSYYLSLRKKNLEKAKEMSKLSNILDPNNGTFQDTYAWVLYQLGKYNEAKKWIEKALENGSKNNAVVLEHYGDILYKLNLKKEALIQWKKSLNLAEEKESLQKKIKNVQLDE